MMAQEYKDLSSPSLVLLWRGKPIEKDKDYLTLKMLGMESNQVVAISRQLSATAVSEKLQVCME